MSATKTYHINGGRSQATQTFHLVTAKDKFIVQTTDGFEPEEYIIQSLKSTGISVSIKDVFPEVSAYVFQLKNNDENKIDTIKNHLTSDQHQKIKFVGTLWENEHGQYQIYTGNVFIKFESQLTDRECEEYLEDFGLKKKLKLKLEEDAYFAEPFLDKGRNIFEYCQEINNHPEVEICTPELVVKRKTLKYYDKKKKEVDKQPNSNWATDMIKLSAAWKYTKGRGVKICIIDDGIDIDHQAFDSSFRTVETVDLLDPDRGPATHKHTSEKHGTACASIACSSDERAYGIAPEADLMVIRTKGLGSVLESEAIRYAADNGADIISCSWGPNDGDIDDPSDDHIVYNIPDHTRLALEYASKHGRDNKGCLIFFAAGNGNEKVTNDGYAASVSVMAIGSVNKDQKPTVYSDKGMPLFCCFPSSELGRSADGSYFIHYGLNAADRLGEEGYSEGDYYSDFGGTSASCPGMAGAAALMLSLMPELSGPEAKRLLEKSCRIPGIEEPSKLPDYGFGIINLEILIKETLAEKAKRPNSNNMSQTNNSSESEKNKTPKVLALHIGVNESLHPEFPDLDGCVNDALFYHSFFNDDNSEIIENSKATLEVVEKKIKDMSQSLHDGDYAFITFAGHGGQMKDEGNEEKDGYDETLVLYDKLLYDDEINNLLSAFRSGVNVVWISDSCHSGTNYRKARVGPPKGSQTKYRYLSTEKLESVFKRRAKTRQKRNALINDASHIKANLVTIAAVKDDQYAGDAPDNGLFTGTLKDIINENRELSYKDLILKAQEILAGRNQDPQNSHFGPKGQTLNESMFFSIGEKSQKVAIPPPPDEKPEEADNIIAHSGDLLVGSRSSLNSLQLRGIDTNARSLSHGGKVNITDGAIPGTPTRNAGSAWEKAYQVYLDVENKSQIDYIEPDIISTINGDPEETQTRGASGYIDTYPDPETRGNAQPLIWHLDDDHTQLKSAYKALLSKINNRPEFSDGLFTERSKKFYPLIAHIDTGILTNHPTTPRNYQDELSSMFANPVDKDRFWGALVAETQGHGQATSTILAGNKMPREAGTGYGGYLGGFPNAQVVSLRISETVVILSGRKFAAAVDYAIEIGVDVITMSMAGAPSLRMIDAVNRAYEAGILIVSAAGNCWTKGPKKNLPQSVMYPARLNRVLGVSAATYDDSAYRVEENKNWKSRAEGSRYMQTCFGPKEVMHHIIAAYSPNITWASKTANQNYYSKAGGGTSSATPQVAAAAAIYMHYYEAELDRLPGWQKVEVVRHALYASARKIRPAVFGNGILRAHRALDPEFEPANILLKPELAAPSQVDTLSQGWLRGIIGMWSRGKTRGAGAPALNAIDQRQDETLCRMLSAEVVQLLYADPELYPYLEQNLDELPATLKEKLMVHPLASSILKNALKYDQDIIATTGTSKARGSGSSALISKHQLTNNNEDLHLLLTGSTAARISEQKADNNNVVMKITVDYKEIDGVRSASNNLRMHLPQTTDLAYLVEHVDQNGKISCEWVYPPALVSEKYRGGKGFDQVSWIYPVNETSRGVLSKIVRTIISIYRIRRDLNPSNIQGMLKYQKLRRGQGISEAPEALVRINNADRPGGNGKYILLLHGIFSCVECTFNDLLENESFINALGDHQLIGYNMSSVYSSIEENANDLKNDLANLGIDHQDLIVIAHSRGSLVARKAFGDIPMIFCAGPHQGSPYAKAPNIVKFMSRIATLASAAGGPWGKVIGSISNIFQRVLEPEKMVGLLDMQANSALIQSLPPMTQLQKVIGVNYNGNGLPRIDATIDRVIFNNIENDMVVGLDSTLSSKVGHPMRVFDFDDEVVSHITMFRAQEIVDHVVRFIP